MTNSANN